MRIGACAETSVLETIGKQIKMFDCLKVHLTHHHHEQMCKLIQLTQDLIILTGEKKGGNLLSLRRQSISASLSWMEKYTAKHVQETHGAFTRHDVGIKPTYNC